jgi:stage II sporulation protein AA (anti-sigma F factor antagonist)
MALAWQSSVWVDVSHEQGALVLHIGGEIDEGSRPSIEPVVIAAVHTAEHVILDCRDLTFCDSAGVAMVLTAADEARRRGCRVSIDNLTHAVERVFDIAAVGELVEIRT